MFASHGLIKNAMMTQSFRVTQSILHPQQVCCFDHAIPRHGLGLCSLQQMMLHSTLTRETRGSTLLVIGPKACRLAFDVFLQPFVRPLTANCYCFVWSKPCLAISWTCRSISAFSQYAEHGQTPPVLLMPRRQLESSLMSRSDHPSYGRSLCKVASSLPGSAKLGI